MARALRGYTRRNGTLGLAGMTGRGGYRVTVPLPSLGTVVEVYGPDPGSARWDAALWDEPGDVWDAQGWRDVTGLAMSADLQWGADRQVGVLSVASAGRLSVSGPMTRSASWTRPTHRPPWRSVLRPGTPVRVRYGALVVRSGWLDAISYSHADRTGDWRASDAVPLLVQARTVVPGPGVPTTLRALARYLVARTGVPVTVEADPEDGDPTIGPTPPAAERTGPWACGTGSSSRPRMSSARHGWTMTTSSDSGPTGTPGTWAW